MTVEEVPAWARGIPGLPEIEADSVHSLGVGLRTRGVFHLHGLDKPDPRSLVLKVYRGTGLTEGGQGYLRFHGEQFQKIRGLACMERLQQSFSSGIHDGVPYALLSYVPGDELGRCLEEKKLPPDQVALLLRQLLLELWIPVWSLGLRFKDAHPRNFIVSGQQGLGMVDTDQVRKSARELLERPDDWSIRDLHEGKGLRRLKGLVWRILRGANVQGVSRSWLGDLQEASGVSEQFSRLGRDPDATRRAIDAGNRYLDAITGRLG